eukprot:TRINITY_DN9149_c0_g1_i1.p2 TRINITY_DN9149_c0_g1~~TRINITY_DN9149_c0_g1_i1.p2  ORF type:complete len:109 (+),score=20.98 TRINITY_DN9149_c0_g1_i1:188-514(+)
MAGTEVTQKTAQKAHKLFSYLWDSAKIVGENVATVAEEVTGAILTNPADITDGLGSGNAAGKRRTTSTTSESTRSCQSSSDAAQYFVEYKALDLSTLPKELVVSAEST